MLPSSRTAVRCHQTARSRCQTGASSLIFTVTRTMAGQAVQVPFVVVDGCGDWPSFAGGGPNAF